MLPRVAYKGRERGEPMSIGLPANMILGQPILDLVIDLNTSETIIIYWLLTLLIALLIGYLLAHSHWTTRMHGRMPGRGDGPRRGPPVVK